MLRDGSWEADLGCTEAGKSLGILAGPTELVW